MISVFWLVFRRYFSAYWKDVLIVFLLYLIIRRNTHQKRILEEIRELKEHLSKLKN